MIYLSNCKLTLTYVMSQNLTIIVVRIIIHYDKINSLMHVFRLFDHPTQLFNIVVYIQA